MSFQTRSEGRDKLWVDEVDPGFAGFGDFMPEVDDLVHVWRLQFAPRWPGSGRKLW